MGELVPFATVTAIVVFLTVLNCLAGSFSSRHRLESHAHPVVQCRVTLSKCRSNFAGKLTAFFSHSAAPTGEKFQTAQSTESPLARVILPSIKIWCLGMNLRSAP